MLFLFGGIALLGGLLLLVYLFVNADPVRLARNLKWTGIVIAVAAVAALAVSGRLAALLVPLAMAMPALMRLRSLHRPLSHPARRPELDGYDRFSAHDASTTTPAA